MLQGVSSAVVWVVGLAVLIDSFGPQRVGRVMCFVSLSLSAGTLTEPLVGGVVFAVLGYFSVFAIATGFVVLGIGLRMQFVMPSKQSR